MDEDIQVLKILSDTADNIYLTKRSNIARIQSSGFTDDAEGFILFDGQADLVQSFNLSLAADKIFS